MRNLFFAQRLYRFLGEIIVSVEVFIGNATGKKQICYKTLIL